MPLLLRHAVDILSCADSECCSAPTWAMHGWGRMRLLISASARRASALMLLCLRATRPCPLTQHPVTEP